MWYNVLEAFVLKSLMQFLSVWKIFEGYEQFCATSKIFSYI